MRMWQEGRQMANSCHPIRAIRNETPFVTVEPQDSMWVPCDTYTGPAQLRKQGWNCMVNEVD